LTKYFGNRFDTWDKIFGDVEEYFAMCLSMKNENG
jgi:hypothetical protein